MHVKREAMVGCAHDDKLIVLMASVLQTGETALKKNVVMDELKGFESPLQVRLDRSRPNQHGDGSHVSSKCLKRSMERKSRRLGKIGKFGENRRRLRVVPPRFCKQVIFRK